MSSTRSLDIEAVAAFVNTAEFSSFTRAARSLGTSQSLVSTRVKRLEGVLGHALLQRHPRLVRLTTEGERFLPAARELMAAHKRACEAFGEEREPIAIGISEQAVGADVPTVLARLAAHDPRWLISLRIEASAALEEAFEQGRLDLVVLRRLASGRTGEVLRRDTIGWFAAPGLQRREGEPLPVVNLMQDCALRSFGARALDEAGIVWREALIGGGMAAVLAAVQGGLGVSPLAARIAPAGAVDVGPAWGLPPLPPSDVVLRSNLATPRGSAFVRELAAAFRAAG